MDLVIHAPLIPVPGETILGEEFLMVPGGKGSNQAVASAKLGAQVHMVGRIGKDLFGQQLLDSLDLNSVNHAMVSIDDEHSTGVALITVDTKGQNSIVVASGANMQLTNKDVENAKEIIVNSDILLLQLEVPIKTVTHAASIAKAHGVTVMLNPAPAQKLPDDLLSNVDILVPNETEAQILSGLPIVDSANTLEAALKIRKRGDQILIFTLGDKGAVIIEGSEEIIVPAFEVTPVDTTAAGDAFIGGLAVALANGLHYREAVLWGNANGALATTKMGAQPSLPSLDEIIALLK